MSWKNTDKEQIDALVEDVIKRRYTSDAEIEEGDRALTFDIDGKRYGAADSDNWVNVVGKPKSRKTFFACCMVASALSGKEIGHIDLDINMSDIIFVDTEQVHSRFLKTQQRIYQIAEVEEQPDRFLSVPVRRYSPGTRVDIIDRMLEIRYGIRDRDLGLLVLDGVADLVSDINSDYEVGYLKDRLMFWQDELRCMIVSIIHLNKNDNNTRGKLGTEWDNKCDLSLKVHKRADTDRHSTVYFKQGRYAPFPEFTIAQTDDGLLERDFELPSGEWSNKNHNHDQESQGIPLVPGEDWDDS